MTETSIATLQRSVGSVFDRVVNDREIVIIRRKGQKDVAIVAADELAGLMETVYLLRSPKNARRLLTALDRATTRRGRPESLLQFRKKLPR